MTHCPLCWLLRATEAIQMPLVRTIKGTCARLHAALAEKLPGGMHWLYPALTCRAGTLGPGTLLHAAVAGKLGACLRHGVPSQPSLWPLPTLQLSR